jgi:hypothetical protein
MPSPAASLASASSGVAAMPLEEHRADERALSSVRWRAPTPAADRRAGRCPARGRGPRRLGARRPGRRRRRSSARTPAGWRPPVAVEQHPAHVCRVRAGQRRLPARLDHPHRLGDERLANRPTPTVATTGSAGNPADCRVCRWPPSAAGFTIRGRLTSRAVGSPSAAGSPSVAGSPSMATGCRRLHYGNAE